MLEPYDVIRYLVMEIGIDIPQHQVHHYWDHWRGVGAEWALHTDAGRDHIPLGLYGDAARVRQPPYAEPQKFFGLFLSMPLFRPRSIRMSRWLIFAIDEKHLYKEITLNKILRRIVWSLNLLFVGRYPLVGPSGLEFDAKLAGKEICGGRCFAITELRGDQLFHKQVWRHKASWKGGVRESVCCLCDVRNFGHNAYYRVDHGDEVGREYSLIEFINEQIPDRNPCTLAAYHCKCKVRSLFRRYSGVSQHACACCLCLVLLGVQYSYPCIPVIEALYLDYMVFTTNWSHIAPCTQSTWGCCTEWMVAVWCLVILFACTGGSPLISRPFKVSNS